LVSLLQQVAFTSSVNTILGLGINNLIVSTKIPLSSKNTSPKPSVVELSDLLVTTVLLKVSIPESACSLYAIVSTGIAGCSTRCLFSGLGSSFTSGTTTGVSGLETVSVSSGFFSSTIGCFISGSTLTATVFVVSIEFTGGGCNSYYL
jgi:hypothetical protein